MRPAHSLTYRPLPLSDPTIEKLTEEERHQAARLWLGRAKGEQRSVHSFLWLAEALDDIDADPEFVALARRAAEDEERHGEICLRVASAYEEGLLSPELSAPGSISLRAPEDQALGVTLYLVETSLSETIGAVTIESCLQSTTAPLARAALRELLTDEINHARLGFAFLTAPHLGSRYHKELSEWLPTLLSSMLSYWKRLGSQPVLSVLEAHGCFPFARIEAFVRMAFSDIALPGFASVGIDTKLAIEWLAQLPGAQGAP